MKKLILFTFITALGVIVLESFAPLKRMRRDGTDPGYTGSPGDSLKNCTVCHGGVATFKEGWIVSDIPETGYTPGKTYTITTKNINPGSTRFGFEISPQNLNGDLMGTMVITEPLRTKLVGDDKYITYKADGVDGIDHNTWTFDWIAPPAGSGEVVFYGAYNSNPGHKGGDGTTLSTLTVQESSFNGLSSVSSKIANLTLFPNPSNDLIKISFDVKTASFVHVGITDLTGKQLIVVAEGKYSGNIVKNIDVSELPQGIYLLKMEIDGKSATQKISVTH